MDVVDEQPQRVAVGVEDLEDAGVGVVGGPLRTFLEGDAVQLGGGVEDAVAQHPVALEEGPQCGGVDRVALLAQLVGVVGPVPWRQLEALGARLLALGVDDRLQGLVLAVHVGDGRGGQGVHHLGDPIRVADGLVGNGQADVVRVPHQAGPFGAQRGHPADQGTVVPLVVPPALDAGRLIDALAGGPVGQL